MSRLRSSHPGHRLSTLAANIPRPAGSDTGAARDQDRINCYSALRRGMQYNRPLTIVRRRFVETRSSTTWCLPLATVKRRSRDPSRVRGEACRSPEHRTQPDSSPIGRTAGDNSPNADTSNRNAENPPRHGVTGLPIPASGPAVAAASNPPQLRWPSSALACSLLSGVLLWASFPPLGWWPLAWIAPVGWLLLIRCERLPGRRPYGSLALGCFLHWLAVLQGIRLAHPALYLGWFALAAYLAVYPVLFVPHQSRSPSLAAFGHRGRADRLDGTGTGARARNHRFFDGAAGAHPGVMHHAAADCRRVWRVRSQFCGDAGGGCLARMLPLRRGWVHRRVSRWTWWPAIPASLVMAAAIAYGFHQQRHADRRRRLASRCEWP